MWEDVVFVFSSITKDGADALFELEGGDVGDDHQDQDDEVDFFHYQHERSRHSERLPNKLKELEAAHVKGNMLLRPCHIVQSGTIVNDVYLPGLRIDTGKQTLRFHWKELFTLSFIEE